MLTEPFLGQKVGYVNIWQKEEKKRREEAKTKFEENLDEIVL